MAYTPQIRDTLLIPSGPDNKSHLFVILNNECRFKKHVLVSFSTITASKLTDLTCRVEPGEHDFIMVPSYMAYRYARHDFSAHLSKCVPGSFTLNKPVSEALFDRIYKGIQISDLTPLYILKCLDGQCRG